MDNMVSVLLPLTVGPDEIAKAREELREEYIKEYGNTIPEGKMLLLDMPKTEDGQYNLRLYTQDLK